MVLTLLTPKPPKPPSSTPWRVSDKNPYPGWCMKHLTHPIREEPGNGRPLEVPHG